MRERLGRRGRRGLLSGRMDSVKKMWQSHKTGKNFKKAGDGHRLDQERAKPADAPVAAPQRIDPSKEARTAGAAALSRFEDKTMKKPATSRAVPAAKVPAEAVESAKAASDVKSANERNDTPKLPDLPVNPNDPSFLRMLDSDPIARAVYNITANNSPEVANVCLATCTKYMENIVATSPEEVKYRKIRMGNKAFQERVCPADGALEFFDIVGFTRMTENKDDQEEDYLVLPSEISDVVAEVALATLRTPPRPPVFRHVKVFQPSEHPTQHWELSEIYYAHTSEDIKRMNEEIKERAETELQLRTKAMRIGPNKDKLKMYRLCCLRVRLPDGLLLQANFRIFEPMARVKDMIRDTMVDPCPEFKLTSHPDKVRLDDDLALTMADLDLIPKALINLLWEREAGKLRDDILATKESLD